MKIDLTYYYSLREVDFKSKDLKPSILSEAILRQRTNMEIQISGLRQDIRYSAIQPVFGPKIREIYVIRPDIPPDFFPVKRLADQAKI